MKKRTHLIAFPLLVLSGAMVWLVGTGDTSGVGADADRAPTLAALARPLPPLQAAGAGGVTPATTVVSASTARPTAPAAAPAAVAGAPSDDDVIVFSGPGGGVAYTARADDTLSELTTALYGENSRANREAVVDANPSLQTDRDHVTIGKDYGNKASEDQTAGRPGAPVTQTPDRREAVPTVSTPATVRSPEMRYTAGKGDTVTRLAEAFFGAGNKASRDAIVDANPALRVDPDRMTAGTTYRIVAPDGLSAAAVPAAAVGTTPSRPGPQPDADDVLRDGSGRTLRYTAKAGDTVTNLAVALLGSDTKANRDAILNANPALKADPDRVVVGQAYWIPAPAPRLPAAN